MSRGSFCTQKSDTWKGSLLSPIWGRSPLNILSERMWHWNGFLHWIVLFSSSPSIETTSHLVWSRSPSCHTCLTTFNSPNVQYDNISKNSNIELSQIHPNLDGQAKIWYSSLKKKNRACIREDVVVKSNLYFNEDQGAFKRNWWESPNGLKTQINSMTIMPLIPGETETKQTETEKQV